MTLAATTQRILERCNVLADISQTPGVVDRRYLTPEHQQANTQVQQWMTEAGLSTWQDAVGNIWGRAVSHNPDAPALIIGSHLDTIPDAGRFDGILGVLLALEAAASVVDGDLPFHVDVVGFCDEEGSRFGTTLMGSKAVAGHWNPDWLDVRDAHDVSLADAMRAFGLDPVKADQAARQSNEVIGFWEVHIEQGPVLEAERLPVGIVTGIAGAKRAHITLEGQAGHAGTTPMHLRRDALVGMAELVVQVEQLVQQANTHLDEPAVATVGQVFVNPGAVNVIPGRAIASLDIRSLNDQDRDDLIETINHAAEHIAAQRHLGLGWRFQHAADAVQCDTAFQQLFADALQAVDLPVYHLSSGAGHDAMAMAALCPMAMLFIRSPAGLSHHPMEAVVADDITQVLTVLQLSLQQLEKKFVKNLTNRSDYHYTASSIAAKP